MSRSQRQTDPDRRPGSRPGPDDPVLAGLHQAEAHYRQFYERAQAQADALDEAHSVREANERLKGQLQAERERANALAAVLKEIHRSLFSGSIYDLILKACLTLTEATRGVYITTRGTGATLDMRAAIDLGDYPKSPASPFIHALCRTVLDSEQPLVCNDTAALPAPPDPGESIHNCVVTPVALLSTLNGVIIVADKVSGDFDERDVEVLLNVGSQAAVAVENARLHREVQHAYLAAVGVLADAMAARDTQAQGRYEQAAFLTRRVAERLALSEYERSVVYYAALLRDIGNIGVSDGVLNKPGPLLDAERALIRAHVQIGHDLICHIPALEPVADVVLHHHERYDGSGYPHGLAGDDIPLAARIVSVVDAYTAMQRNRSYREAYSDERAREELRRNKGSQFDPRIVEVFLAILAAPGAQMSESDEDSGDTMLPGLEALRNAPGAAR